MTNYNDLIEGLKQERYTVNYDQMFNRLASKERQHSLQKGGAFAGLLVILLIGLAFYLAYPANLATEGLMATFDINGSPDISDGPVVNYIFSE